MVHSVERPFLHGSVGGFDLASYSSPSGGDMVSLQ